MTRSSAPTANTDTRSRAASRCAAIMAELFGKVDGCCRGRGGSMHIFDASNALLWRQRDRRRVACRSRSASAWPRNFAAARVLRCASSAKARSAEGEFHESMNLAALWGVPVLFVCENNRYAMGTALERSEAETDFAAKVASYRMRAESVDGMDVLAVEARAREAVSSYVDSMRRCFSRRDLSVPCSLDVRPAAVPQQVGGRGMGRTRSPDHADQAPQGRRI